MNKAFTKQKELKLDENFKIVPDSDYGVILIFLTEKENKKKEIVPFEEKFYYPRIAQALRKYTDLSLNKSESIPALIKNLNRVYFLIESIDNEFKQF